MIKLSSLNDDDLLVIGDECDVMNKVDYLINKEEYKDMCVYTCEVQHANLNAEEMQILEQRSKDRCIYKLSDWNYY